MKKFTGLFLSILMILSVCTVSVSADDSPISGSVAASDSNKMFNSLSDTIWKFDSNLSYNGETYTVSNENPILANSFSLGQSFLQNTNSKLSYDATEQAIHVDVEKSTTDKNKGFFLLSSYIATTQTKENATVRFTMKTPSLTAAEASLFLRTNKSGSSHREFITLQNGKLYFCNYLVGSYEANQWYTFDFSANLPEKYAHLSVTPGRSEAAMKGETTQNTKQYDFFFENLLDVNGRTSGAFEEGKLLRIGLAFQTKSTVEADWYVGEYYQNAASSNPRPTLSSLNCDFRGTTADTLTGASVSSLTLQDYLTKWYCAHLTTTPPLAAVEDGLAIVRSNSGGARTRIAFHPFTTITAPKCGHRMDVSVGGNLGSSIALSFGQVSDSNSMYTVCYLNSATEMYLASGDISNQASGMKANTFKAAPISFTAGEKNTPLRVKIFYDEKNRKGVVGVESNGKFTCSEFTIPSTVTETFKGIALWGAGSGKEAYYDDLTWDITPSTVTVEEAAKIAYSNDEQANLDETVTFTYSETLRQPETATVTVTSGDSAVTTPYTVSYDDNKMLVHFSALSPNTSYTVTAPTMTTLSGLTTESLSQSKTFTTVNSSYSATKPSLSESTVSSILSVPYAAAKSATLLVAVYNSDGSLNTVTSTSKTIARDGDGTMSVSLPTVPAGGSWKAFVWDGLSNLKPLTEAGESNS